MIELTLTALLLLILGVAVPRMMERAMPEGIPGMALCAGVSALILWALSTLSFAGLYALRGPEVLDLLRASPGAGLRHFASLGAKAALIWAPVMLLTVFTWPRRWKEAVW